jgi:chemotaxis regulatin CheY-phosphate phosphatase CheZ
MDPTMNPPEPFITVPARARDEIGELAFYLEQMLRNLREVNDHIHGTSREMPGVLHDLRDIVRMTEKATVTVLEETEALMDDARTGKAALGEARAAIERGDAAGVDGPLGALQGLLESADRRSMSIMSALEFQDLTTQKIQRAFEVLEEVIKRLGRIRHLVDLGRGVEPAPAVATPAAADPADGQALADELLRGFQG